LNTRSRGSGILVGVGAGLALVVLLILQSLVGSGLFSTRTLTSTTTAAASTIPDAYQQVSGTYANHLLLLEARNVSALVSGYEGNATIEWTGDAGGLAGNHTGAYDIAQLLDFFPGKMTNLTVTLENETTIVPQGRYWVVSSAFEWAGYSTIDGTISGQIVAHDTYVNVDNLWLIATETWYGLQFNCAFPACTGP